MDVVSRLMKDRILLLGTEVTDDVANVLVSQMLYLASADPEADITLYINSPGGSVQAGLAIFDTMQYIPCEVNTVCYGMAASMGAFLLSAGTKGKRRSLPNSRIMIHQPLGGSQGEVNRGLHKNTFLLYIQFALPLTVFFCFQEISLVRLFSNNELKYPPCVLGIFLFMFLT